MTAVPGIRASYEKEKLTFPITFPLLPMVRFYVREWAAVSGLPRDRREAFVLAAYETACNAVLHGGGHGLLRLYEHHGALHCQVFDQGPGFFADADAEAPESCGTTTDSKRGLWMVRQLTDHLKITTDTTGTVVSFAITLPP